jgi:hypothetical protein
VLRAQRHYSGGFSAPVTMLEGSAPISSLTVALDFRADSIILWVQAGKVHAQWVSNAGRPGDPQVLGPAGYHTSLAAVLSDDNRAFVLWVDQPPPGSPAPSTVYLDHSAGSVAESSTKAPALEQPGGLPSQRIAPRPLRREGSLKGKTTCGSRAGAQLRSVAGAVQLAAEAPAVSRASATVTIDRRASIAETYRLPRAG